LAVAVRGTRLRTALKTGLTVSVSGAPSNGRLTARALLTGRTIGTSTGVAGPNGSVTLHLRFSRGAVHRLRHARRAVVTVVVAGRSARVTLR
jgi:hypothetical protein